MPTISPPNAPGIGRTHLRSGFTLIEAMAASVVLAFCVVAISAAVTASNQAGEAVDSSAAAMGVARADMETLASQPLSTLATGSGGTTQTIDLTHYDAADAPGGQADASATVSFISRSALQGARDIAVVKVKATMHDGQVSTLYRIVTTEGNGQ